MNPNPATTDHVFISYARDGGAGEDWAKRIQDHLEDLGQRCWRDETAVAPGDDWLEGIPRGLDGAQAVVLVVSRGVGERPWVLRELAYADQQGLRIIPAVVEAGAQLPFGVNTRRALDFSTDPGSAWRELHTALGVSAPIARQLAEAPRSAELGYLHQILERDTARTSLRLYVPLAGRERQHRGLQPLVAEEMMPVSFRFERVHRGEGDDPVDPAGQTAPSRERGREIADVLEVLGRTHRLVVLGEPGAGKTFSLWRIAVELAHRAEADPEAPLPVFVPLGQWIDPHQPLEAFIAAQLGPLADHGPALLAAGRLALLLDGLNELPTAQRGDKVTAIWGVIRDEGTPVLVVSCREHDYTHSPELRLELDSLTIQPLGPVRVHRFIRRWLGAVDPESGEARAEELFWHLAGGQGVRGVWQRWRELGLGLDAFWGDDELPEYRPTLWQRLRWRRYQLRKEGFGALFLWEEERRAARNDPRGLLRLAATPYLLTMILALYLRHGLQVFSTDRASLFRRFVEDLLEREDERWRRVNEDRPHPARTTLVGVLGRFAWELQNRAGGGPRGVQLALPLEEARGLLSASELDLARAAGLLEGGEPLRFGHQLLQEWFTALGMRLRIEAGELPAARLWPRGRWWEPTGWEEATVMLGGFYRDDPGAFVDWIGEAQPTLVLRALRENRLPEPDPERKGRLRAVWLPRLDPDKEPTPEGRQGVGIALGALGLDDRPGVGLTADGLPDIDWVEVPAGPFLYGEDKGEEYLDAFAIARYPVTNAQYQAFIDDGGYREDRWWQGLAQRLEAPHTSTWKETNRPRTDVSWYEAMAYCRWLSAKSGKDIRLPSERQWEKAARGSDGREYPWGDGYRTGFANINETVRHAHVGPHNLGQTTAVGIYPQGSSPYGVHDLAGNVSEWCLDKYDASGDLAPAGKGLRVLRGGSWIYYPDDARGASRDWSPPDYRYYDCGFRVLCSSPI